MIIFPESLIGPAMTNISRYCSIIGLSVSKFLKEASDEIPDELMNMIFWLVIILIAVIIILVIFIWFLTILLKQQARANYPIKSKVVLRKSRILAKHSTLTTQKLPTAKPAKMIARSARITGVRPIRITQILPGTAKTKNDSPVKSKLVAKPVQRETNKNTDLIDKSESKNSKD